MEARRARMRRTNAVIEDSLARRGDASSVGAMALPEARREDGSTAPVAARPLGAR
jgi:hypothetical protein